jgi:hypothetical protein
MSTAPELPALPVGCMTDGEEMLLRAWAEDYGSACAAAEREAIAKECENFYADSLPRAYNIAGHRLAAAIRARGTA